MLKCSGEEMILLFHEYFNDKVASDWFRKKVDKMQTMNHDVTLRNLTEPFEEETDNLVMNLAELSDKPSHKTQSLLRNTDDKVITSLMMRWFIVTEYFHKHGDSQFPHSEYLVQFIVDYLTNHWRWMKEQPDN